MAQEIYKDGKKNLSANIKDDINNSYKAAKKKLRQKIANSKKAAWLEIMADLDKDPWGKACKIVIKKLKNKQPIDICAKMDAAQVNGILSALFPIIRDNCSLIAEHDEPNNIDVITSLEIDNAFDRMAIRKLAPGPDGLDTVVWKHAYPIIRDKLLRILQECIELRRFQETWKASKLDKYTGEAS